MTEGRKRGSRHSTTIVLVALAGAAATWLFVAERSRVTSEERAARRGHLFSAWRGDDVAKITIVASRGGFSVIRKHPEDREDRGFMIESSGAVAPADPQSVDKLLSTLELATVKREVPATLVDRSAMGLDVPRSRIEVSMGELSLRVAIGNAVVPGSDGTYAEVDGERVVVVADALADALDVGPESLRDRGLVPYASPDLAKIALEGEGGLRRFERASWPASRGTSFRFEGGGPRVDARAFGAMIEALASLDAEVLVEGEPAPADARVVVTLVPKMGPDAVIALGAPCPGRADLVLAARRAPTKLAGCVAPARVSPFLRPRDGLEDHRVIGASLDELVEVKVEHDGEILEMARRGTGFFVRKPEERTVPEVAARGFLDALIGARGELETVEARDLEGEGRATLRIISRPVADGDPERIETVVVGPIKDGRRAIRRDEDGTGLWVAEAAVRPLLVGALMLRERNIVDVPGERVREVAVVRAEASQRVRRAGNAVELVEPRGLGLVADETWSLELLDRSAQLEALRWISATDDGSFGLATPRATLEIHIEDQLGKPETERTVRVALGTQTDDGSFARVVGAPEVFLAPPELETAALRSLVDRAAFGVRPADVAKLELRVGSDKPFVLERREGALVPASLGAGDASASTRAAKVRDGLEDLVALSAITVGEARREEGLEAPVLTLDVTPVEGRPYRVLVGASDVRDGASIHYARRSDVGATFAVAPSGVRALLEALR